MDAHFYHACHALCKPITCLRRLKSTVAVFDSEKTKSADDMPKPFASCMPNEGQDLGKSLVPTLQHLRLSLGSDDAKP
jgi:hypothetical protein